MPSNDAQALSEWITTVARELGLEESLDSLGVVDLVLDLTSDVAHGVSRPGAPVTSFLVGVAAGRADDPTVTYAAGLYAPLTRVRIPASVPQQAARRSDAILKAAPPDFARDKTN